MCFVVNRVMKTEIDFLVCHCRTTWRNATNRLSEWWSWSGGGWTVGRASHLERWQFWTCTVSVVSTGSQVRNTLLEKWWQSQAWTQRIFWKAHVHLRYISLVATDGSVHKSHKWQHCYLKGSGSKFAWKSGCVLHWHGFSLCIMRVQKRNANPTLLFSGRDTVAALAKSDVRSPLSFDWLSQLRYYWKNGETLVQMITTELVYGYEYLGNSARLVITPLTDRCYRLVM